MYIKGAQDVSFESKEQSYMVLSVFDDYTFEVLLVKSYVGFLEHKFQSHFYPCNMLRLIGII